VAALGRDGLRAHAVPVLAAGSLRRQEAFSYLVGGGAAITVATLAESLAALDVPEAVSLVIALDRDGDGQVGVADIEHALASAPPPAYRPGCPDPVSRSLRQTAPCPVTLRRPPTANDYAAATGAL
jgi:hypothetical protein